ncbi:MAG: DoxX family protein [Myxococcota bacterium]
MRAAWGVGLVAMALFYAVGGLMHFVNRDFYLALVPAYLPWHSGIVAVSGVAEIGLGLALLVPRLRTAAAWGLIALLIAVFPANIYAAGRGIPGAGGWLRLPVQGLFLAWAWVYTRPRPGGET